MQTLKLTTLCRRIAPTLVIPVLAAVLLTLSGTLSLAQTPKEIGKFRDWVAYIYKTDQDHVCYATSWPKKSAPKGVKRGEIYLAVSHRPRKKVVGEVSVVVGYPFKNGTEAIAEIKGKTYSMPTRGERAWAVDAAEDRRLIKGMKAGSRAIVRGISSRGTKTTDNYSLLGFTAAYNAITRACK